MKKLISLFISIVLYICCVLTLCGCGLFDDVKTDSSAAKENLEKLIGRLDSKDNSGVKALFAANKIADIQSFDEDISELLDIYKGSFVSHDFDSPATINDTHNNVQKKWFIIGADITTTEEKYRATMYWCDMDTSDKGNVGIWSLYIFNVKYNPLDDYTFYGDNTWSDDNRKGIYVVKPFKYISMTMKILQSGNVENVKTLFAPKVLNDNPAFDESAENFFSYYSEKCMGYAEIASDISIQTDADGHTAKRFRMLSYSIDTADAEYSIAIRYCDIDTENSGNIGLHSIYIRHGKNSADTPYWGDNLWFEGINIQNE